MKSHRFSFEPLEGRALFSVVTPTNVGPAAHPSSAAELAATTKPTLTAAFNIAGTFTKPLGNPDAGPHYHFTGTGKTAPLGNFTMTADVQTPGFVANGHASGTLTLTTPHGTLTLKLQGPPQSPGTLPKSLSFTITKGTGSYAHATGKGQIACSASNTTHKFLFKVTPSK